MHACEGEIVCISNNPKIPYFNAPIYLENKSVVGKVDEILGPMNQVYFTVKPQDGIVATSFKEGEKFYIGPDKLLPLERFLPKPKAPAGTPTRLRDPATLFSLILRQDPRLPSAVALPADVADVALLAEDVAASHPGDVVEAAADSRVEVHAAVPEDLLPAADVAVPEDSLPVVVAVSPPEAVVDTKCGCWVFRRLVYNTKSGRDFVAGAGTAKVWWVCRALLAYFKRNCILSYQIPGQQTCHFPLLTTSSSKPHAGRHKTHCRHHSR